MLLFEFLFTFLKGILIGMLVSAPMGPTGLLCLRETTRGGRRQGMLVGLGATLSDLVYGLIAYWGVGIVLNLLDEYSSSLRLGGSIFILGFCAILLTRRVTPREDEEPVQAHPLKSVYSVKKVSGSFFLTLSNPFIILLFLPLYTRVRPCGEATVRGVLCRHGRYRYRVLTLVGHPNLHSEEALHSFRSGELGVDQPNGSIHLDRHRCHGDLLRCL